MAFAVLTRDSIAAYADALAPLGLESVAMPVTKYESTGAELDIDCDLVVVASPRAAAELVRGGRPRAEVWALGAASASALGDITAIVLPDVTDGASLARAMGSHAAGKRVLLPRAESARPELAEGLRSAGADVIDVVAYRTIAVPADAPELARGLELLRGDAAVCVAFAPSQVEALFALCTPKAAMCAIGETTAKSLREHGVAHVAVAPTPTPEGIAIAVRSVYPKAS